MQKFELDEFAQAIGGRCLDNDLLVAVIGPDNLHTINKQLAERPDSRPNVLCFALVLEGEMNIIIDHIPYRMTRHTLMRLSPVNTINHLVLSDRFSGYCLLASRNFINDTLLDKKPIPVQYFLDELRERKPYLLLSAEQSATIRACILRLSRHLDREHFFKKELLTASFYILILETVNLIASRRKKSAEKPRANTRKNALLQQFLYLLQQNGRKEHSPAFYSDKMCISTQYLSLILKEISGQTAGEWISGNLIREARKLLSLSGQSIQQVSETLCFSDQSAFGKFFRKHTGISPKQYKERHAFGGK